ncbi:IS1182 family transposase [Sporomusa sphaeroides]|uniref:IS1182 family transposase n=1 Tax=Sporomusa sphaeroides TaxID=47679 RepID=UPI003DA0F664
MVRILKQQPKQLSLYSILYDKISNDHILKAINNAVDLSFINKQLASSYSKDLGRPAKEPEMMARLLILQYLYNFSDVRVIEETRLNLAYMWFVGINPEEELPDASLLAKFRTQRLKDTSIDDIIQEVVRQCVDKGIIKGTGVSIDATHTLANTVKKMPERVMKHLARKILRNLEKETGCIPDKVNPDIPEYKEITDPKEAKATMKEYLETMMQEVENAIETACAPETAKVLEETKEILKDEKFILQKGLRSLIDKNARVGYKTQTDSFFGYKVEYMMIPEERIITAVKAFDGAYVDGTDFDELYNRTKACGLTIKQASGDKAYFRKAILDTLKEDQVEAIIPVSASVYKIDENKFSYNKDSDQWICEMGNVTVKKVYSKTQKGHECYRYTFDKTVCQQCTKRAECAGKERGPRKYRVGLHASEYYEYSQVAQTDAFKE